MEAVARSWIATVQESPPLPTGSPPSAHTAALFPSLSLALCWDKLALDGVLLGDLAASTSPPLIGVQDGRECACLSNLVAPTKSLSPSYICHKV